MRGIESDSSAFPAGNSSSHGLTKRELFTMHFMQACLTAQGKDFYSLPPLAVANIARFSASCADCLIRVLNGNEL